MNDDVHPSDTPSAELAAVSAILDGTATADERALVEASSELGGLVDELRAHREVIAEVEVPDAVRESAIAAALAAFDELHAGPVPVAAVASTSNVVSLERRRRLYRVVTGAAAALVVVIVGVAAINLGDGSSDDDSATMAVDESAATSAKAAESDAAGGADAAPEAAVALSDSGTADSTATDLTDAPLPVEGDAPAATDAPAETASPAEAPPSTIGEIPGPADVPPAIADEDELAQYAADTQSRVASSEPCLPDGSESLGQVTYQGRLAEVTRDDDDGQITVYAVDDCSVLTTIRP